MWYCYVLESIKNKRKYIGFTKDLRARLKEHNSGEGGAYTSKNRPYKLIYYEAYLSKDDAQTAEMFYKSGYGREVLKGKIKGYLTS